MSDSTSKTFFIIRRGASDIENHFALEIQDPPYIYLHNHTSYFFAVKSSGGWSSREGSYQPVCGYCMVLSVSGHPAEYRKKLSGCAGT